MDFVKQFQRAVAFWQPFQKQAREDLAFWGNDVYSKDDLKAYGDAGKVAIKKNFIRARLNLLSGYQRMNRFDVSFVARGEFDDIYADIRKGMTLYVEQKDNYQRREGLVFDDGIRSGLGGLHLKVVYQENLQPKIVFERCSSFNVYVDPEAREPDFSDAQFIFYARWADKDMLKKLYPEQADAIGSYATEYNPAENPNQNFRWFDGFNRARVVECWFKDVEVKEVTAEDGSNHKITVEKIKFAVYLDSIKLEEADSPYLHGALPFSLFVCYRTGEDDIPAGVIRDLKDPQREINKRAVQWIDTLNRMNGQLNIFEEDAISPENLEDYQDNGAVPGYNLILNEGALSGGKFRQEKGQVPPVALIQAQDKLASDFDDISGINPAMMGSSSSQESGVARQLQLQQGTTYFAYIFDNFRAFKRSALDLLWGGDGRKGLIQQFMTHEVFVRVTDPKGVEQQVQVNQRVPQYDLFGQAIDQVINDVSVGEFDVIISDTPNTVSIRQMQHYSALDAVKCGVPMPIMFETLVKTSDWPDKAGILQNWSQAQQQIQGAQGANDINQMDVSQDLGEGGRLRINGPGVQ